MSTQSTLLLNAVLSDNDANKISTALATVRQTLPFLVGLTIAERRRLFSMGTKAQTFVEKALNMAEQYPDVVPARLDVALARQHLTLFQTLHPIQQSLQELSELVDSTQMLAGSEAYASARLAYRSVKSIGSGFGLDAVVNDLSRQFRRNRAVNPQVDMTEGNRVAPFGEE